MRPRSQSRDQPFLDRNRHASRNHHGLWFWFFGEVRGKVFRYRRRLILRQADHRAQYGFPFVTREASVGDQAKAVTASATGLDKVFPVTLGQFHLLALG